MLELEKRDEAGYSLVQLLKSFLVVTKVYGEALYFKGDAINAFYIIQRSCKSAEPTLLARTPFASACLFL